jgi:hypothetical protein
MPSKTVRETEYNKTIQYKDGQMTYCINYRKEFHKSFINGFRWVEC